MGREIEEVEDRDRQNEKRKRSTKRVWSAKEKAIQKGKYNEDINSPRANFETSNYCQAAPRQIGL